MQHSESAVPQLELSADEQVLIRPAVDGEGRAMHATWARARLGRQNECRLRLYLPADQRQNRTRRAPLAGLSYGRPSTVAGVPGTSVSPPRPQAADENLPPAPPRPPANSPFVYIKLHIHFNHTGGVLPLRYGQ